MKRQSGYIALITVLVIGAASLTIALGLLLSGVASQKSSLSSQQAAQAVELSTACAEEGLNVWRSDNSFTGSGSLTLGAGGCTYTVTRTATNTFTVDTTGTVNDIVRKSKVYATIGTSSVSITSWQEVI